MNEGEVAVLIIVANAIAAGIAATPAAIAAIRTRRVADTMETQLQNGEKESRTIRDEVTIIHAYVQGMDKRIDRIERHLTEWNGIDRRNSDNS